METCEQPILAGFADESLYSAQACHVSRRALPGSDEAARMTVGSGRQCSMLFDQSSPLGAFSKILLESLAWGNSLECCHVWARWDTAFELSAFELRRWEQATTESGCSLLPTPTVPNGGRVNPEGTSVTGRKPDGSKAQMDLGHAIKLELSPTPHANCSTGAGTQGRDGGMNLQTVVQLSPTPRMEGFDAGNHRGNPDSLHAVAKLSSNANSTGLEKRQSFTEHCRTQFPATQRTGDKQHCLRGFWYAQSPLCGGIPRIPNRSHRLKALGNAVVPQQVYPFFAAIAQVENMKAQ